MFNKLRSTKELFTLALLVFLKESFENVNYEKNRSRKTYPKFAMMLILWILPNTKGDSNTNPILP